MPRKRVETVEIVGAEIDSVMARGVSLVIFVQPTEKASVELVEKVEAEVLPRFRDTVRGYRVPFLDWGDCAGRFTIQSAPEVIVFKDDMVERHFVGRISVRKIVDALSEAVGAKAVDAAKEI